MSRISYWVDSVTGEHCFEIRHLFEPSYFDTKAELRTAYQPLFDWLEVGAKGNWDLRPMDNAAFSDVNEDYWVGYYLTLEHAEDAATFKVKWG